MIAGNETELIDLREASVETRGGPDGSMDTDGTLQWGFGLARD